VHFLTFDYLVDIDDAELKKEIERTVVTHFEYR